VRHTGASNRIGAEKVPTGRLRLARHVSIAVMAFTIPESAPRRWRWRGGSLAVGLGVGDADALGAGEDGVGVGEVLGCGDRRWWCPRVGVLLAVGVGVLAVGVGLAVVGVAVGAG